MTLPIYHRLAEETLRDILSDNSPDPMEIYVQLSKSLTSEHSRFLAGFLIYFNMFHPQKLAPRMLTETQQRLSRVIDGTKIEGVSMPLSKASKGELIAIHNVMRFVDRTVAEIEQTGLI